MPLHLFVLEALASMGYTRSEIEDSLGQAKYDDVFATYLLLGRKTTDVSRRRIDLGTCRINVCEVNPLRTNVAFAIIVKFCISNMDVRKNEILKVLNIIVFHLCGLTKFRKIPTFTILCQIISWSLMVRGDGRESINQNDRLKYKLK